MLMDSGANDMANYQGKSLVQWAHLFKDNDKVGEMVWDHLKTKHGISDKHFSKGGHHSPGLISGFSGGKKKSQNKNFDDHITTI